MKLRSISALLVGVLLIVLAGCADDNRSDVAKANSASTPTPQATNTTRPAVETRPPTRIMPLNVEGRRTELELTLLDQPLLPFTTYFPAKEFKQEAATTELGQKVRLYFNAKGVENRQDPTTKATEAYIDILMPNQPTSLEQMQDLILGEGGVMTEQQWELVDRTNIVSYPWVKEKLMFEQSEKEPTAGAVYIGEYQGKAFYILTRYPVSQRSAFEPRMTIVLENLQFRDEE